MEIVFIDEGESNRAIMAKSLYDHIVEGKKKKKKNLPKSSVATVGKNKSLHMKGMKALREFGLTVSPCSRKDVKNLSDMKISEKTRLIVLGHDNDKKIIKKKSGKAKVEFWAIDNPVNDCLSEVKLRFFRRVRDQLWVNLENLVAEIIK